MAAQHRKPEPSLHLDASLVPLKNALLHRAEVLEDAVREDPHDRGAIVADRMAAEFRELAAELHHW